jgi:hypothetical protein
MLRESQVEEFQDSQATEYFILLIDELFDRLNCRRPNGYNTKSPLSIQNLDDLKELVVRAETFLLPMCNLDGQLIILSKRRTGVLGLLCAARSLLEIGEELLFLYGTTTPILSYRLSQDHLELFFNAIRRSCKYIVSVKCFRFFILYA